MRLIPASGRQGGLLLALVAVVVGAVVLVAGVRSQDVAPQSRDVGRLDTGAPRSTATSPEPPDGTTTSPPGQPQGRPGSSGALPLGPSEPVHLSIPSIGVDTPVFPIGLAPDGTLAVPQPGPRLDHAAWFDNSPTPGQPGPAVIEGHSDSVQGPSVFFRLAEVRPGARILVTREDGARVEFRVDAVRDFAKSSFPTELVYGARDLSEPTLRLITCSGFDADIGHHVRNTVVFAHFVAARR